MVLVADDRVRPERVSKWAKKRGLSRVTWIYLGVQFDRMRGWEDRLGEGFARMSVSEPLQAQSAEWRDAFFEWLFRLGLTVGGEWWTVRSAFADRAYLLLCYAKVAEDLIRRQGSAVLVVCESPAVLETLTGYCEAGKVFRSSLHRHCLLRYGVRFVRVWSVWGIGAVYRWALARLMLRSWFRQPEQQDLVVIHACVSERAFGTSGVEDAYFPGLRPFLSERGLRPVTLGWSLLASPRDYYRAARTVGQDIIVAEREYSIGQLLTVACRMIRRITLRAGATRFLSRPVGRLVREAFREIACEPWMTQFAAYPAIIRRISRSGVSVDTFVDMFENMDCEKPPVAAIRRWLPGTRTVGFQHYSSLFPSVPHLGCSPREFEQGPFPDRIVCSSRGALKQMVRAGFSEDRLVEGPSLRHGPPESRDRVSPGECVVLLLPLYPDVLREFLDMSSQAFSDPGSPPLLFKLHPATSSGDRRLVETVAQRRREAKVVTGPLSDALDQAACAVASGTTAAVEGWMAGVPTITVGREAAFDQDPLGWYDCFPKSVRTAEALRSTVDRVLSTPIEGRITDEQSRVLASLVSPVNAETMGRFIVEGRRG